MPMNFLFLLLGASSRLSETVPGSAAVPQKSKDNRDFTADFDSHFSKQEVNFTVNIVW